MEDVGPQVELEAEVQIIIHSSAHMDTVLSSLEEQRKKNFLCDITLVVDSVQFRAHKALLAASSEYFAMMFADEGNISQSIYVIEGVATEVFEALLQFIYTGNVLVNDRCLKQIVATAQVLKVDNLVKAYADYQQNLLRRYPDVSDNGTNDEAEEPVLKRKRGRPRKQSDQNNRPADIKQTEKGIDHIPESIEDAAYPNGSLLHEHEVADFAAEVICDLNPKPQEEPVILKTQRHSKRRSQRSVKLQGHEGNESTKGSGGKRQKTASELSCKDCGRMFKYPNNLALHCRSHADKKTFTCDRCGKHFSQKRQLRSHYRVHIGEKPYTCEVCGKSFTAKSSLHTHMIIHRGEKPYGCNICGKAFADSSAKRRHLTLHTGKKPYSCPNCSLQFARMDNLKTHISCHTKVKKHKTPTDNRIKEDARRLVQMQQYQLVTPNAEEIQLLVTENVHNLNFMSGHGQDIGIVTAEAPPAIADQAANLTLITEQLPVLHELQVAKHQAQPIHNIDLESQVQTLLPEQMHVVTLSKEALDQLQGGTHEIHLTQTDRQAPVTQVQAHPAPAIMSQNSQVPVQTQALTGSPVTQPVSPVQAHPTPTILAQNVWVPAPTQALTGSPVTHSVSPVQTHPTLLTQNVRVPTLTQAFSGSPETQPVPQVQAHKTPTILTKNVWVPAQSQTLTSSPVTQPVSQVQVHPTPTISTQNIRVPVQTQILTGSPVTHPVQAHPTPILTQNVRVPVHTEIVTGSTVTRPVSQVQAHSAPTILTQNARVPVHTQTLSGSPVTLPVSQVKAHPNTIFTGKIRIPVHTQIVTGSTVTRPVSQVQAHPTPSILTHNVRVPVHTFQTLIGSPVTRSVSRMQAHTTPILTQNVRVPVHAQQSLTVSSSTQPVSLVQAHSAPSILNQSVEVPEHAEQTLTVSPVTQPIPGHPIQAQPFQIQPEAVSPNTILDTHSTSV